MPDHRDATDAVDLDLSVSELDWAPDVLLGDAFEAAPLGEATLVRPVDRPARPRATVLHVHGFNDYFFQDHLARAVTDAGHAFYAVDLRRAGRSLRPGDVPHFTTSLRELGEDVDAAARAVRALEPGAPLVVHAHSTGGLTASIWAHARRDEPGAGPDLLVLDSPFLNLHAAGLVRVVNAGAIEVLGRTRPMAVLSTSPSMYATYQLRANGGRWDFDPTLKRPESVPKRAGWVRAVVRAQVRLARGLEIPCPVLVATSASSGPDSPDNPDLDAQDTVLDVDLIDARARRLGERVDRLVVEGGVHDLTLSADGPRKAYLEGMLAWVAEHLPADAS
ncbi:alpha/beta hydrolase [Isoptericola variabilis]|uniref:alpha/beta hydrolase n=1 Tax=Isoptericola variabilis TaxID=139208 RepID=UPI001E62A7E4|nr:alpha/beta hydrolase [Isoptericola variabilis]